MSKFYEFSQNNSRGHFDVNNRVTHRVFIEADTEEEAIAIFEPMIEDQSGSCPCCGERWSLSPDEVDLIDYYLEGYPVNMWKLSSKEDTEKRFEQLYSGFECTVLPHWNKTSWGADQYSARIQINNIEDYAQVLANLYGYTEPDAYIYYKNDSRTSIYKRKIYVGT